MTPLSPEANIRYFSGRKKNEAHAGRQAGFLRGPCTEDIGGQSFAEIHGHAFLRAEGRGHFRGRDERETLGKILGHAALRHEDGV